MPQAALQLMLDWMERRLPGLSVAKPRRAQLFAERIWPWLFRCGLTEVQSLEAAAAWDALGGVPAVWDARARVWRLAWLCLQDGRHGEFPTLPPVPDAEKTKDFDMAPFAVLYDLFLQRLPNDHPSRREPRNFAKVRGVRG